MNQRTLKTLGEKIRMEREQRGWEKAELAQKVGVSPTYINKIENDKLMPTLDVAKRFAKVLEFSLEEVGEEVLTAEELDERLQALFTEISVEPDSHVWRCDYAAKRAWLRVLTQLKQRRRENTTKT
jgi:transcriptional regulator with XRE-family HTH domain